MATTLRSPAQSWWQLFRAPNLLTVPGDPLAGFLMASHGRLDWKIAAAISASLLFYAFGLVLNDLADFAEDARERPDRPLPSGEIPRAKATRAAAAIGFFALSLCVYGGVATTIVGAVLMLAICSYDLLLKKIPVAGALTMGVCRGSSLLLGFAFASGTITKLPTLAILAASMLTLYIAAATNLARFETKAADLPKLSLYLPSLTLTLGVATFLKFHAHPLTSPAYLLACTTAVIVLLAGIKVQQLLRKPDAVLPPIIGKLIRLLLPLQAMFCLSSATAEATICAAILLAAWPCAHLLSRRFYAS